MRTFCIVLLVWLACGVCIAHAEPGGDEVVARAHYATGLEYYDRAQYRLAAREFAASYRSSPRPALLYNMARTYQKLGDLGTAVDIYTSYLRAVPDAIERDAILAALVTLRSKVATVRVRSQAVGAVLLVDREPRDGALGELVSVTAGRHELTVRSAGLVDASAKLELRAGDLRELALEPLDPKNLAPRIARPRWLWPVVGVGAAVVAATAITLGITFGRTDYAERGRASCVDTSCILLDSAHGLR